MEIKVQRWFSKNKGNLILLLISLTLGLFLIESANYFSINSITSYAVWQPNINKTFLPNSSILKGINGSSSFTINKLGYRGPLIKDKKKEYRILVIGGSTSECLYLDNSETWPFLIMEKLGKTEDGRKVIAMNIGKSGQNLRDHILELRYLKENYDPDVIILMVGANDMLLKLSKRWVWKPFNEENYDYTKTFYIPPNYSLKSTISYKLGNYLYSKFYLGLDQDSVGENLAEKRLERQESDRIIGLNPESGPLPELGPALEDYEKNLKYLIDQFSDNVTILFSTQPSLWKANMSEEEDSALWMSTDFNRNFYSTGFMEESMDKFNEKLLDVCSKRKEVLCIDMAKEVPKSLEFFYDDMHFNEKGAEFVAKKFSEYIRQNIKEFEPSPVIPYKTIIRLN